MRRFAKMKPGGRRPSAAAAELLFVAAVSLVTALPVSAACPPTLDDDAFYEYPSYITNYGTDIMVNGYSSEASYALSVSTNMIGVILRYATTTHVVQAANYLNAATIVAQAPRVVAAMTAGAFGWITTWNGVYSQTPGAAHVMRRFFDYGLSPLAQDASVFDPQTSEAEFDGAAAVFGSNGDVVFVGEKVIGTESRVLYRRYNAAGQSQTGQLSVSAKPFTGMSLIQERWPAVVAYSVSGEQRFAVVWSERDRHSEGVIAYRVYFRVFRANGTAVTNPILVNTLIQYVPGGTLRELVRPDVWATGGGFLGADAGIVVSYVEVGENSSDAEHVYVHTYNSSGTLFTASAFVPRQGGSWNATLTGTSWAPTGSILPSMYWLVSWWYEHPVTGVPQPAAKLYRGIAAPVALTDVIYFSPSSVPVPGALYSVDPHDLESTRVAATLFRQCGSELRAGFAWTTLNDDDDVELRREVIAFGGGGGGLGAAGATSESAWGVTPDAENRVPLLAPLYDVADACAGHRECEAAAAAFAAENDVLW